MARSFLEISCLLVVSLQVCFCDDKCGSDSQSIKQELDFALNLYGELSKTPGDLFFSPSTVSFALTMISLGADGETLDEIFKVTKINKATDYLFRHFCLAGTLFTVTNEIHFAKYIYVSGNYQPTSDYVDYASIIYYTLIKTVDFSNETATLSAINGWVAEKTNDKIKNLLSSDAIDSLTKLVLVNAIYFKADWNQKFNANKTRYRDFHLANNTIIQLPMMRAKIRCNFTYNRFLNSYVLEMPYKGDRLSLMVILPALGKLTELENKLSTKVVSSFILRETDVTIELPKFKLNSLYSLNEPLISIGTKSLFSPSANLTKIYKEGGLYLSLFAHGASIELDEEGSDPANSSDIYNGYGPFPPVFRADCSFLFFVKDEPTRSIVFMGRFTGE